MLYTLNTKSHWWRRDTEKTCVAIIKRSETKKQKATKGKRIISATIAFTVRDASEQREIPGGSWGAIFHQHQN